MCNFASSSSSSLARGRPHSCRSRVFCQYLNKSSCHKELATTVVAKSREALLTTVSTVLVQPFPDWKRHGTQNTQQFAWDVDLRLSGGATSFAASVGLGNSVTTVCSTTLVLTTTTSVETTDTLGPGGLGTQNPRQAVHMPRDVTVHVIVNFQKN